MDQTFLIPAECGARCAFCPFPGGGEWSPEPDLDEVLARLRAGGPYDRLYFLGGDLLESERAACLLRGLARSGTEIPPSLVYSPLVSAAAATLLRELPFVAGLIVPFVGLASGEAPGAPPVVEVVRRAQALERERLEIVPYLYVHPASAEHLPRLFDLLCRKLRLQTAFLRAVQRPPFPYAAVAAAVREVAVLAKRHGVALTFREEGPPACVEGLRDAPELFQRTVRPEGGERVQAVLPHCERCDLRRRCEWRDDAYVARFGAAGLAPIQRLPERHVREFDPQHPEDVLQARWYVERAEIEVACTRPWTAIEMMGVIARTASPCAEDWLKAEPDRVAEGGLLGAWNGPAMTALREAIGSGAIETVCWPQCVIRTRGLAEPTVSSRIYLSGSTAPFVTNLLVQYQEILAKQSRITSRPSVFGFGPTFACNNRCRMCFNTPKRAAGIHGELEPAFYDEVRESFLPFITDLLISGPGEPLLSKPFLEFLTRTDWERYPDVRIQLTTNGRRLTPELVERLMGVPIGLFLVSVNAATPETYRVVAGRDGFADVIGNLSHLRGVLHQFRHCRPELHLSFVVMRSNYRELGQFLDLVKRLGAGLMLLPMESNPDNQAEALWRFDADYEDACRMIAELRETYRKDVKTAQYLETLASSLAAQRRDPHLKGW